MKARVPFIICGLLGLLVTFTSIQLLRPPRLRVNNDVGILLVGYTNQGSAYMAILQVTNRSASAFLCHVGPRMSDATRNGRCIFHDLYAAASAGALPAHGAFTFAVPAAPGTDNLRVSVDLQEMRAARPAWQESLASALRCFGIRALNTKAYYLTSPPFSRPVE
jgi:hypothetical protein